MIKTIKSHVDNDIKLIKAAWDSMDTLSHVLVFLGVTLLILSTDIIANRIHFH
jgi:hypothetical protein